MVDHIRQSSTVFYVLSMIGLWSTTLIATFCGLKLRPGSSNADRYSTIYDQEQPILMTFPMVGLRSTIQIT